MVKNLVLLVVLGLLAVNAVSATKCYQCEGCAEVKNDQLLVCEKETFPPVEEGATTKPPEDETTIPSEGETTKLPEGETTKLPEGETTIASGGKFFNKYNRVESDNKEEDNAFRCLKYTKDQKIYRSCTKRQCKAFEKEEEITGCLVCAEDGCNFGTNIQSWAFSTIIFVAIIKYLL